MVVFAWQINKLTFRVKTRIFGYTGVKKEGPLRNLVAFVFHIGASTTNTHPEMFL